MRGQFVIPAAAPAVAVILLAVFSSFASTVLAPTVANARSAQCKAMRLQLASVGNGNHARRYLNAARAQEQQMQKVQSRMRHHGCRAKARSFLFAGNHPSCQPLRNTLKRMKKNLAALRREAKKGKGGKAVLRRKMRQAGCKTRSAEVIDKVFSQRDKNERRRQAESDHRALTGSGTRRFRSGVVRTICVRTCDGSHFPVSFSTTPRRASRDADQCASLCPGTQMALYLQRPGSIDPDRLVSHETGEPYSALPTAFAYKKSYNRACSCNFSLAKVEETNRPAPDPSSRLSTKRRHTDRYVATPTWREDSRAHSQMAAATSQAAPAVLTTNSHGRRVRIVGESFLPDQ